LKLLRACVLNFEHLDIWQYSIGHPSENYCRLNLLQTSIFNLEHLNILRDSIGHPSKKLLSFEFATSIRFLYGMSRYIMGLNRTSVYKVIVVWICYELPFSISSISIYYGTQPDFDKKVIVVWIWYELPFPNWSIWIYYKTLSDIWVKSYCHLNLLRASVFNMERLDILWDSIGHPCIKLLSFEFATSIHFQYGMSRYIMGLNRTSVYKVIVVWICYELPFSISSNSIYYRTQPDIWEKGYCRLTLVRASVFKLEHLDILQDSVGHLSKKFLSSEFATSIRFQYVTSRYIMGLNRTSVYKVIVVWIRYKHPFSIWNVSIYYGTQSDICV